MVIHVIWGLYNNIIMNLISVDFLTYFEYVITTKSNYGVNDNVTKEIKKSAKQTT